MWELSVFYFLVDVLWCLFIVGGGEFVWSDYG